MLTQEPDQSHILIQAGEFHFLVQLYLTSIKMYENMPPFKSVSVAAREEAVSSVCAN